MLKTTGCKRSTALLFAAAAASLPLARTVRAQRVLGIDVSDWQGTLTQSNWNYIHSNSGKAFAFIRSSRGGTTGFYDEHDAPNNNGLNTLSQRYDDTKFYDNMDRATAAGMYVGPYHFGRADIIATTLNSGGIANTGADEANHMLQQAGPYMRPGFLLPVFDLESGASQRTADELAQFAVDFGQTIYNAKGVWPIVYSSSSYASDPASASNGNKGEIRPSVSANMPNLWIARWPSPPPSASDVQTIDPPAASGYPNVYGVWNQSYPTIPNPQPWKFWQYSSSLYVPISSTGSLNIDTDVAHGDINYLKDFLVPALWVTDSDGQWTDVTKWNSNADASGHGGPARLPNIDDRVIIDRPAGNFLVTLSSGNQSIRSLLCNERFTITGGSLTIAQYAQFSNTATLSGGALSAASVTLSSGVVMSKGSGTFVTASFINNGSYTQTSGAASFGAITGSGSINVIAGSLSADSIKQTSLTATGGALKINAATGATSIVSTLSITGSAGFDLTSHAIVVNYSGASPIASIKSQIVGGYANGAWNGAGINSSSAAASVGLPHRTALGYAEAIDLFTSFPATFKGESVDTTSILIAYAAYGDANLNNTVDTADFNILASNFGATGKRWSQADFNYDAVVDTLDFNLLAANFSYTLPGDALGAGVVPEPLGALFVGVLACTARQRRRHYAAS